jgi:hypothetical protein
MFIAQALALRPRFGGAKRFLSRYSRAPQTDHTTGYKRSAPTEPCKRSLPATPAFKARLKSVRLTGWEGGLPPPQIEWRSTSGGKPTFPTLRLRALNHPRPGSVLQYPRHSTANFVSIRSSEFAPTITLNSPGSTTKRISRFQNPRCSGVSTNSKCFFSPG